MGMRAPSLSMMYPDLPMIGLPVFSVCFKAQSAPHMLALYEPQVESYSAEWLNARAAASS